MDSTEVTNWIIAIATVVNVIIVYQLSRRDHKREMELLKSQEIQRKSNVKPVIILFAEEVTGQIFTEGEWLLSGIKNLGEDAFNLRENPKAEDISIDKDINAKVFKSYEVKYFNYKINNKEKTKLLGSILYQDRDSNRYEQTFIVDKEKGQCYLNPPREY